MGRLSNFEWLIIPLFLSGFLLSILGQKNEYKLIGLGIMDAALFWAVRNV